MLTRDFWRGAAERAAKTLAQALIAAIGTEQLGILELDWRQVLSLGLTAAVLSLLTSVASAPFGPRAEVGTPSLVDDGPPRA